jgi:hypothetical protein
MKRGPEDALRFDPGTDETSVMHRTTRPHISRIRAAAGAAAMVCVALGAVAGSADGSPRDGSRAGKARAALPTCPVAGRAEVVVPDGVDGIRIFVGDARPGAATDVTVLAAGSDRTLRAFAPGVFGLELDEPLRADRIQVALEPVLDATSSACVDRVELLRGGAVVGTALIR